MELTMVVVPVPDMTEATAFCEQRLGLAPETTGPWWSEFAAGSAHLALEPVQEEAHVALYFDCLDLGATVARLRSKGVAVSSPTVEVGMDYPTASLTMPGGVRLILREGRR